MIKHLIKIVFLIFIISFYKSLYAIEAGNLIPSCQVKALGKSNTEDLQKYKGQVIYVDFWASWCGPCSHSFPFLEDLHQKFKDKGLKIIAINMDENVEDAKDFLEKTPATFEVVSDVSAQCAKDFDVKAMPSSYIIDRQGVVHKVHFGFRQEDTQTLLRLVETLITPH